MSTHMHTRTRGHAQTPFISAPLGLLQRECACGQHTVAGGECEECRRQREGTLQRAAITTAPTHGVPSIVHDVLDSPGQSLDAETRAFMEPRFGQDFSGVRVHTGSMAAESARAVNALAYTVGRNVVFGAGQPTPDTSKGRQVLAHELTHVVQQAQSRDGSPALIDSPGSVYEQEAEQIASMVSNEGVEPNLPIVSPVGTVSGPGILQRLGANPGCTAAETSTIHQAIFNARGWLNKAIPQLEMTPLPARVVASLRRNFGPHYGVAENAALIAGRLRVAYHELSTNSFGCAGATEAMCAAGHCGYTNPGSHATTICRNVTLTAGDLFQAGCVLHEAFHAAFSRFTATVETYSGWYGASSSTATYPGTGIDPLLNADSYTKLAMDLS